MFSFNCKLGAFGSFQCAVIADSLLPFNSRLRTLNAFWQHREKEQFSVSLKEPLQNMNNKIKEGDLEVILFLLDPKKLFCVSGIRNQTHHEKQKAGGCDKAVFPGIVVPWLFVVKIPSCFS